MSLNLRDYQEKTLSVLRDGFKAGHKAQILYLPTGGGKCLGLNTPVLMANGKVKMVQDVIVGDQLLGPDGGIRNVLSLAVGREMLYRITPVKGDSYVVNASHILSLRKTSGSDGLNLADGSHVERNSDIVNVNVETFLNSNSTVRHSLKGWRSDAIEFNVEQKELLLDPYWLGVWLGDGTTRTAAISKPFCKMVDWWIKHAESFGHTVTRYQYRDGECPMWNIVGINKENRFISALDFYGLREGKHIPASYITASLDDRRKLIAGLIDSDGSLGHNGYDWITKFSSLARDFAFICRSVGLAAYVTQCKKGITGTGFVGDYWRVSISGNTDTIPCLDKPAMPRLQKKRHLVHGISIESIGDGDYYGFEIDGDKLFLLGDFTVTHNTECAIALLDAVKKKGNRSAMILDRIILCDQTSQRLTKYGIDHGVLQSGHWRYRPHEKIQVCSAQTLERRNEFPGLQIMIIDEAHVFRDALKKFIEANPDILVIGLTATPFTKGLGKIFTNVVSTITTKELVDQKVLVPLRVYIAKEIDMTGAKKVAGEWSQEEATTRGMKITGDIVAEWIKKTHEIFGGPRKTIVFCSGVAHGADLAEKFAEQGYNFMPLSYKDSDEFKRDAVEDFKKPDTKIHGLIATDILTRGFDVPDVMIGVSARPFTKSLSSHVQQMGRVMRGHEEKSFAVWLCHSGNYIRFREDWDDLFENGVSELDDGKEKTKPEPTEKEKKQSKCPKCGALWLGGDVCSMCGFVRERTNAVSAVPGTMEELAGSASRENKQSWWSQIQWYVQTQGWSPGRGAHLYKDKFGVWPKGLADVAAPPSAEINAFILKKKREYIKSIRRSR